MCNVNIATGEVTQFATDFFLPGMIPLHFVRSYSSTATEQGPMGYGWRHNLETSLRVSGAEAILTYDGGKVITVPLPAQNFETPPAPAPGFTAYQTKTDIVLTEPDRNKLVFPRPAKPGQPWLLERKEDPYGNAIRFRYDDRYRLVALVDSADRFLTFHYDACGQLSEVRLALASRRGGPDFVTLLTCEYDVANNLIAVTDRTGLPCTYGYHDHLLVSVTNRVGGHLYYQYDHERRCIRTWRDGGVLYREIRCDRLRRTTAVVDSRGYATLFRNNEKGRTEEEVDPLGRVKQDVFDANGNLLVSGASGGLQEVVLHDKVNNVLRVIANNGEVRYQLNEMGQPLSMTAADGLTSSWEYDHGGSLTRSVSPRGAEWRFAYDERGRIIKTIDPLGYQVRHERTSSPPTATDSDELGVLLRRTFDALGNMVALENECGQRTEIEYGATGDPVKVIYADRSMETYTFDAEGNRLSFTDGSGLTSRYEYDLNGSLVAIIDPAGERTTLQYDSEEKLIAIINTRGERSELRYDVLGRELSTTYFDGRMEYYEYDDRDRIVAIRTEHGQLIVGFDYDDSGRLVGKKWADGKEVTITYGAQNEILALGGADQDLIYEWDPDMNNVKQQVGDVTLEFEYDLAGNRIGLKTSTGRQIRYEWDLRRRLTKITDSDRYIYEYSHTPSGCIREMRFANGLRQRFEYDELDRMILRSVLKADGTELTRREFRYDGQTRLIGMRDLLRGVFEFHYDSQDHLRTVVKDGRQVERYEYDGEDNLLLTREGDVIGLEPGNRAVRAGDIEYHYDYFGNLVLRKHGAEETRYEYNLDGDLVKALDSRGNTFEFQYDPLGRRVAKVHNGRKKRFLWDGVALLSETENGATTDYLFMPESFFPVGQTGPDGHYACSFNQVGTPTELFDEHGDIAWALDLTAFGEVRNTLHAKAATPFRFLGQYADDELGLFYTHYRYYDPKLGRFISPDPIRFTGGPNFYRYVVNPVNWVDPFGLGPCYLRPKCNWSKNQQADYKKKANQWQRRVNSEGSMAKVPCDDRKVAKDIYNDCIKKGYKLRPLVETSSKCSNEQADHKKEVISGGDEEKCTNLQPMNESVNKSVGATLERCMRDNGPITSIVVITSMIPGKSKGTTGCRPGGRKCPD